MADNYLIPGTSITLAKPFLGDRIGTRKFTFMAVKPDYYRGPSTCEFEIVYSRTEHGEYYNKAEIEVSIKIPLKLKFLSTDYD